MSELSIKRAELSQCRQDVARLEGEHKIANVSCRTGNVDNCKELWKVIDQENAQKDRCNHLEEAVAGLEKIKTGKKATHQEKSSTADRTSQISNESLAFKRIMMGLKSVTEMMESSAPLVETTKTLIATRNESANTKATSYPEKK